MPPCQLFLLPKKCATDSEGESDEATLSLRHSSPWRARGILLYCTVLRVRIQIPPLRKHEAHCCTVITVCIWIPLLRKHEANCCTVLTVLIWIPSLKKHEAHCCTVLTVCIWIPLLRKYEAYCCTLYSTHRAHPDSIGKKARGTLLYCPMLRKRKAYCCTVLTVRIQIHC